jgi:hypothetical protein
MIATMVLWVALGGALVAARVVLRGRGVFLLGKHGPRLAPTALMSIWLAGLLVGQVTKSLVGMMVVAALPLVTLALLSRRHFQWQRARHPLWTRLDLALVALMGCVFWLVDLWDLECHRVITAQFLHGNLPPTALNNPHAPLAYHALYDGLVAVVLAAVPVDLLQGMAIVSIACMAFTVCNLAALSRMLFRSPPIAQLGRALFICGYGPVLVRALIERDIDALHGRTSQSYVDIILRRPSGLGFALFTLMLALLLPRLQPAPPPLPRRWAAGTWLICLLPSLALLPQAAEETILLLGVLFLFLVLSRRRLPWGVLALLGGAVVIGLLQSGVVLGVLGHGSMATPHLRPTWPPMLPSWKATQDGVLLWSRDGLLLIVYELGPFFLASLVLALRSGDQRRRMMVAFFAVGFVAALLIKPSDWQKSDVDRFLFYGTPLIFMLSAAIVEKLRDRYAGLRARPARVQLVAAIYGALVCGPPLVVPLWRAAEPLRDAFAGKALGGDLKRHLAAVGPREPILTTVERADDLLRAGFIVIAPLDTNSVGIVTRDHFDDYVRAHDNEAAWLFFPEDDARVKGRPSLGRDDKFVLVRAPAVKGPGVRN